MNTLRISFFVQDLQGQNLKAVLEHARGKFEARPFFFQTDGSSHPEWLKT